MTKRVRHGRPLIGITADFIGDGTRSGQEAILCLPQRYCLAVQETGGIPFVLPVNSSMSAVQKTLAYLHGLVISGGDFDIHPRYYGEPPIEALGTIKEERTQFELALVSLALKRDLPLLGICGGAQAINVALGGTLYQDIPTQLPHAGQHQKGEQKAHGGHPVRIHPGTRLQRILKKQRVEVNTTHHQAVKTLGTGLIVNAISEEDELIEGIESPSHSFVLGTQWHPEVLFQKDPIQRKIFSSFIAACSRK